MKIYITSITIEASFSDIKYYDDDLYHAVNNLLFSIPGVNGVSDIQGGFRLEVNYDDYSRIGNEDFLQLIDNVKKDIEKLAIIYAESKNIMRKL